MVDSNPFIVPRTPSVFRICIKQCTELLCLMELSIWSWSCIRVLANSIGEQIKLWKKPATVPATTCDSRLFGSLQKRWTFPYTPNTIALTKDNPSSGLVIPLYKPRKWDSANTLRRQSKVPVYLGFTGSWVCSSTLTVSNGWLTITPTIPVLKKNENEGRVWCKECGVWKISYLPPTHPDIKSMDALYSCISNVMSRVRKASFSWFSDVRLN